MDRAHKRTIWGSHGRGSQTHNLGLTWPGPTNIQFGAHLAGAHTQFGAHLARAHTQFGAHMARAHTHNLGLTWPGLTHTQFGAYISQSQSKFILVLFFQDSFIFQIYFENSGPQSTCYLEWTLTPFYCKWYGLEIEYILGM